jgi:type I restriction enzyme R subunit
MVMLARWIRETMPDGRILIVTDRKELDEQIEGVFGSTGDKVRRASSGAVNGSRKTGHHGRAKSSQLV